MNIHWGLRLLFGCFIYYLFFPYTKSIDIGLVLGVLLISLQVDAPIYVLIYILAKENETKRKCIK